MKNILIGIDLDGTLLTTDKKITPLTYTVLEQAISEGCRIVPITGRPLSGIPEALYQISGIEYVITSNGAVTYHVQDKAIIESEQIKMEKSVEIYDGIFSHAAVLEAFIDGYGYEDMYSYNYLIERFKDTALLDYIRRSRKCVSDLREYIVKTTCFVDEFSIMCQRTDECNQIKSILSKICDINVIETSENELEVYSMKAGKGNALIQLGKRLGIQKNLVVAIGDGNNDIDMFQKVGFSIAMGNATEKLKRVASCITLPNNQDGVAWAIKKYFL